MNPFLVKGSAYVTERGVLLNNNYYSSSIALWGKWYEVADLSGGWMIEVLFSPFDINQFYYLNPETTTWITFNMISELTTDKKVETNKQVHRIVAVNEIIFNTKTHYNDTYCILMIQ